MTTDQQKMLAAEWFKTLRDQICAEFERIESECESPARFERKPWQRPEGGGGEMSVMKGQVFEKVGVNISAVHGAFSETMRKEIPGADTAPFFWACGISVVAHPCSPLVPAAHMNTRFIAIGNEDSGFRIQDPGKKSSPESRIPNPDPCKSWFGGGADLTPVFPNEKDTADFHAALKSACDAADPDYYGKYKKWCDGCFFF